MSDTAQTQPAVHHWDQAQFEASLKDAKTPVVLVDFYAEWCGPCRLAAPIIADIAEEYKGRAHVGKVNVDEVPREFMMSQQVMSIPTVKFYVGGVEQKDLTVIGFPGKEGYVSKLEEALKRVAPSAKVA